MEDNPLIPFDGERLPSLPRTTQVAWHAGECQTLAPTPAYPPAHREPRGAAAAIAFTVLAGLVKDLGSQFVAVLFWLRLPLLWLLAVVTRLAAIGAGASLLFWWLSSKPEPVVVATWLIALGVNFTCHLLLCLYDGFLLRIESRRF